MRLALLFAASSFASLAAAQPAPTPPVPPPLPQPGSAEPLTQKQPDIPTPKPDTEKKDSKWDVSARHAPGRDVPIDTRTGTWMSLDVSPDGREVAFDMLGDIYVVPITGGEARPLLTGHAWEMQPRYSRHRSDPKGLPLRRAVA
jgi:hypothetical protein